MNRCRQAGSSISPGASNQRFGSTGDFVFAYRMREIFYKRGWKTKEYSKRAVLGEHMTTASPSERGEPELFIEDVEIRDDDVEVDGESYPLTDDDGVSCNVVF